MRTLKMNLLLALTLLLIPSISKAQESTVTIEFDNAETASEVVQNYIAALQKGDVATMNMHLADHAMIYGLGGGLDSLNVAQHKEYFKNSTDSFKHTITQDLYLPVKVTNNWNEGEWVLAWGTNTLTNKETAETIVIPYHTANLVENGKIVMSRYFYDMMNVMMAQGYKITAPE
ncbi:nuclear transport factor 2 family protein [Maribacter sp. MJ134]|uniref:nuclear transport factor 2 family protein n=1 Tax=Maribacter sp. MJ134 TaxID=2496865 RepID=UPI000F84BBFE|nr:nuclear transport factor 2 family protein [Maribacter sp. MJ134]AZQ57785.1 nuclear transport factor 2 family protein [Maribacter sp. MJ134]